MGSFLAQGPVPRLRLGMVGGGQGAFIGAVHRIAARIDDQYDLVAGALASTPDKAVASGQELGLAPDRIYSSFEDMARRESERADGIEVVSIVTPNHLHYRVAEAFLRHGISVICDKPMTTNLSDARRLKDIVERSSAAFILTHNYSGYPMVRQAREMVANGELGKIRVVQAEYIQGWLSEPVETTGGKQAEWRTDPQRAGGGGSIGDIGTHAFQLAEYVSGQRASHLAADLESFVPGRQLDDNAHIMLRFAGGAKGMIWSSQVAVGKENALQLRIYGEKGGLEWQQESPNQLTFLPLNGATRTFTRGGPESWSTAARVTRIPAGHPEGYLEGFATIYSEAAEIIRAKQQGRTVVEEVQAPGVDDGLSGVSFIDACLRSNQRDAAWAELER
ncbi:MAG: Gfo/Idh/MocA family oxidoreductase [Rhizobiaceae bacterium]